jgi:integrase
MTGTGTIYQRGGIYYIFYSFHGKRHRESTKSTRRADAVKLLRRRMGEIGSGRLVGPDAERTTFDDLARMLVEDYTANERKSLRRVHTALTHLRPFFAFSRALNITTDRLNVYVSTRREEHAAPATIKQELALLRRAFTLAIKAGHLAVRPAFPTITVHNTRTGFFERAEFEAVRDALPGAMQAVATFAYLTGWRKQEILGLQWSDVDLTAGVMRLEPGTTKNREGRAFPFSALPDLAALLRAQREVTTAVERRTGELVPWVFHRNGRQMHGYHHAWRTACEAAGLSGRLMHDFRRTAVRNLERAGVPRSVAMQLTGHKTEAVYRRYAIVAEADLREGVAKLATLHAAPAAARTILPFRASRG